MVQDFFACYPGNMTPMDRGALRNAGCKVHEDAVSQYVRIRAEDHEEARRRIVMALRRSPEGLAVRPYNSHLREN